MSKAAASHLRPLAPRWLVPFVPEGSAGSCRIHLVWNAAMEKHILPAQKCKGRHSF